MTTHSYLIVQTNTSTQSVMASCPKKIRKEMHYGKKNNNKSFLFLMLLLIILFSMNIIIINGYKIIDGLSVAINGVNEIIPYSTRSSYITLCEKKHIEPIDECATALESKTIERLYQWKRKCSRI